MKPQNNELKRKIIYDAAQLIKSYGYRVFVTDHDGFCFLHFSNGERIAYVQLGPAGLEISNGTTPKFTIAKGMEKISLEMCRNALRMIAPEWYSGPMPHVVHFSKWLKEKQGRPGFKEI